MFKRNRLYAFLLLGFLIIFAYGRWQPSPILSNDAFQYLDAADNLLSKGVLGTSLAVFEEQVDWGRFPVPLTHFPPAYPILIAALGHAGISLPMAGYIIAVAAYLAVLWLILEMCALLAVDTLITALLGLLWASNYYALMLGSMVGTDVAFTALTAVFAALILYDLRAGGRRPFLLIPMGLVVGVAYSFRYAGLFLIPTLCLYFAWRWACNRRLWPWVAGGLLAAAMVIAPIMIRNAQTIGSWRGGHTDGGGLPPVVVLFYFFKAVLEVPLGPIATWRLGVSTVTLLLGAAYLVVRQVRVSRRVQGSAGPPAFTRQTVTWMAILSAIYALGIILTELTAFAWDTRYYFPLYPLALVGLGVFLTPASNVRSRIACAICAISLLAYNARSVGGPFYSSPAIRMESWLQQEVEPGVSMKTWLQRHARGGEGLVSVDGQAVHFVTGLPVLSIIPAYISTRKWDEAMLRDLMRRFKAPYVLVFPGAGPNDVVEQRIPLFKGLAMGSAPSWLTVAARSRDGLIYSCGDCVNELAANRATGQRPPFASRLSSSSNERAH
jgi:hypothetical protein